MTGQWTYVDVGAVRIQRYVSRTPRLKGQRGASAWLCDATSPQYVRQLLAAGGPLAVPGIDVNPEAGEADGIVSVRFPAGPDPGPDQGAVARAVAEALVARLRSELPAIELTAWWGSGPSYLDVYRDHEKAQGTAPLGASGSLESRPAPGDFPPLASCVECRADPAVATVSIHEARDLRVCLDCQARYEDRYRRPGLARHAARDYDARDDSQEGDPERGLPVYWEEATLARELGRHPVHGTVRDFSELARLGSKATNRNHVATMYADGNKIGDFFKRIAKHGDPDLKARASAAVSAATRAALLEATRAVTEADGTGNGTGARARLPVIPHIVGGDDVVVSVTADRAWRFAVTYLEAFGRRLASIEGVPPELLGPIPPSASAGLVFAHAKFPFRRALELAGEQMRAAKQEFCGELPAIGWLDVTRDGERPPAGQSPWQLTDLTELSGAVLALRQQVEPSGRATLGRLIDVTRPPEVSVARVREHARRLEREPVLGPFLASGDPAADARRVAGALSLARWWS